MQLEVAKKKLVNTDNSVIASAYVMAKFVLFVKGNFDKHLQIRYGQFIHYIDIRYSEFYILISP